MRDQLGYVFEALVVIFSALAAWWSKRNNNQLKPDQMKTGRAAHSRQNNLNGEEIPLGDLVIGILEETNRIHDRLDKMKAPK